MCVIWLLARDLPDSHQDEPYSDQDYPSPYELPFYVFIVTNAPSDTRKLWGGNSRLTKTAPRTTLTKSTLIVIRRLLARPPCPWSAVFVCTVEDTPIVFAQPWRIRYCYGHAQRSSLESEKFTVRAHSTHASSPRCQMGLGIEGGRRRRASMPGERLADDRARRSVGGSRVAPPPLQVAASPSRDLLEKRETLSQSLTGRACSYGGCERM